MFTNLVIINYAATPMSVNWVVIIPICKVYRWSIAPPLRIFVYFSTCTNPSRIVFRELKNSFILTFWMDRKKMSSSFNTSKVWVIPRFLFLENPWIFKVTSKFYFTLFDNFRSKTLKDCLCNAVWKNQNIFFWLDSKLKENASSNQNILSSRLSK